jgi:hypothetical protein
VLEELAPDEVRILRVLALEGDQPIVDVEASGRLGAGGRTVARRLSTLDKLAGVRHAQLIQLYLDNLLRLGLAQLRDEPLEEEEEYQVLESQHFVGEAKDKAEEEASKANVVRRRITLSHFGRSFCEMCIPLDDTGKRSPRRREAARRPRRSARAAASKRARR